ncbi:MAG: hypothetical protein ACKOC5_16450 [Chloroflexota bacterium]
MNREERGNLYLLTGLVLGVVLGLLYAWNIQPVEYTDTQPESLRSEFKDQYRALIAAAYLGNADLVRAQARLELLQDPDLFRALSEQAQRTLAEQGSAAEARALGMLAIALGQAPPGQPIAITPGASTAGPAETRAVETPLGDLPITESARAAAAATQDSLSTAAAAATVSASAGEPATQAALQTAAAGTALVETAAAQAAAIETGAASTAASSTLAALTAVAGGFGGRATDGAPPPSETPRPRPTFTPTFTLTVSPTPGAPFLLLSREKLCDRQLPAPLIQVEALDRYNNPMSGILVIVKWQNGEERFYTGLKPEKGAGYADFSPAPGVLYSLQLGENGQPEAELAALVCTPAPGERYWGAWLLRFVQP